MAERVRCAIYTRKSSDEGLDQDFNSLDAQHEACAAYIASQKAESWVQVANRYDDGGLSGGTLERPALQRLLADIDAGRVDRIVVYKIDRLTRSLPDFAKIVETLDGRGASFVSVTQSFNTATSMGRLTLNMLLSFAQFEREVTAERIRDKIAASKRKGLWMGGTPPFGYKPNGRTLEIVEDEAEIIRHLFQLYLEAGSLRELADKCNQLGYRTRGRSGGNGSPLGGAAFVPTHLHNLLTNPVYIGRVRHKAEVFDGQHPGIVDQDLWDTVQSALANGAMRARGSGKQGMRAPLTGKLYTAGGQRLTPTHTLKDNRKICYYISRALVTGMRGTTPRGWRLPAKELEPLVAKLIERHLTRPEAALRLIEGMTASELGAIRTKLECLAKRCKPNHPDAIWPELLSRATLEDSTIALRLDSSSLAAHLDVDPKRIDTQGLKFNSQLLLKRRGVETRIQVDTQRPNPDPILAANILNARRWYAAIKSGQRFAEIARAQALPKSRIRYLIPLAFLAPDLLGLIAAGKQPFGFTSQYVKQHGLPVNRDAQREVFKRL